MSEDKKHPLQRLLDNPWALLAIGLVIVIISYSGWGWYELANTPKATLP